MNRVDPAARYFDFSPKGLELPQLVIQFAGTSHGEDGSFEDCDIRMQDIEGIAFVRTPGRSNRVLRVLAMLEANHIAFHKKEENIAATTGVFLSSHVRSLACATTC